MHQERRSGQRHAVFLSVELCQPGKPGIACRAHNLAPEGMLLENNQDSLQIGSPVELRISWNERSWMLAGFVTHCNSDCIGVMFKQRQSELYRTVTRSLDGYSRPTSRRHLSTPGSS